MKPSPTIASKPLEAVGWYQETGADKLNELTPILHEHGETVVSGSAARVLEGELAHVRISDGSDGLH